MHIYSIYNRVWCEKIRRNPYDQWTLASIELILSFLFIAKRLGHSAHETEKKQALYRPSRKTIANHLLALLILKWLDVFISYSVKWTIRHTSDKWFRVFLSVIAHCAFVAGGSTWRQQKTRETAIKITVVVLYRQSLVCCIEQKKAPNSIHLPEGSIRRLSIFWYLPKYEHPSACME